MKTTIKRKKVEIKKESTPPQFSISITLGTDVYKGEGASPIEALQSIPKPLKIMTKGVVRVSDGVKTKEVLMYPLRLRRLFYNKLFQAIQLKSLCTLMK